MLIQFYICLASVSTHHNVNSMATEFWSSQSPQCLGRYCIVMFWSPLYYQDLCSSSVSIFWISKQDTCINSCKLLFLSWPQSLHLKIEKVILVCLKCVFLQTIQFLGTVLECERKVQNQQCFRLFISLSLGKLFVFYLFACFFRMRGRRWL